MHKYIFIYNADSGIGNALVDYGKKLITPSKQDCELCTLTYGPFGKRTDWKQFIKTIDGSVDFLHKDEFEDKYPKSNINYPAFIKVDKNKIEIKLSRQEFSKISSLDDLIPAVRAVI